MPHVHAELLRQSPRFPLLCQVLVRLGSLDAQVHGQAIDISATGMGLRCERRLRIGERVTVLVDPAALPVSAIDEDGAAVVLGGTVTGLGREGDRNGRLLYRIGVCFTSVPERVARELREVAGRRVAESVGLGAAVLGELAQAAPGRERLYQLSLERLAARDFGAARDAVRASLKVIPHARHARALLCRVEAEAALADGRLDEARRRIGHGRGLSPDDGAWPSIEARVQAAEPRTRRGLWARLLG
jgi:hypothetical protein